MSPQHPTRPRALVAALLAALLVAVLPAAVALAQAASPAIVEAAEALATDNVYVAEGAAPTLTADEQARLREAIREASQDAGAVYIAVLPPETLQEVVGSAAGLPRALADELSRPGAYFVVAGTEAGYGQTNQSGYPEGSASAAGDAATANDSPNETLPEVAFAFVDGLGRAAAAGSADAVTEEAGSGIFGTVLIGLVLLALVGVAVFALRRARRRAEDERRHTEEVRGTALEDLQALDRENRSLQLDADMPDASADLKRDYVTALESYSRASLAIDNARRPQDFQAASQAIEEGQFAVATANARKEGRPLPERTLPCFFDPRHGPSVRDVLWAPPGGQPREVPACAADALRVEKGREPAARTVDVDGQRRPYWDAPAYYGPWAGGWYGGGGSGFLSGLLLGSWFLPGFGGFGWGGGFYGDGGGGGGGDMGGDFGGGDWGGGDFGGGDFGGGGDF